MSRRLENLEYNNTQTLDLHLVEETGRPLVVCIHGGGFVSGSKADERCRQSAALLNQAGINCASVSYSLAPPEDRFAKWPRNLIDIADAIAWLHNAAEQYAYDFARLGLLGYSAGCCFSNLYTLGAEQLFATFSYPPPVYKPLALAGFYGPYDFPSRQAERKSTDDELNLLHSPSYWFECNGEHAPPVLHVHGNLDTVVYPDQHEWFQSDYWSRKLSFKAIIADGFGHSFAPLDRNDKGEQIDLRDEIADFFTQHLG